MYATTSNLNKLISRKALKMQPSSNRRRQMNGLLSGNQGPVLTTSESVNSNPFLSPKTSKLKVRPVVNKIPRQKNVRTTMDFYNTFTGNIAPKSCVSTTLSPRALVKVKEHHKLPKQVTSVSSTPELMLSRPVEEIKVAETTQEQEAPVKKIVFSRLSQAMTHRMLPTNSLTRIKRIEGALSQIRNIRMF